MHSCIVYSRSLGISIITNQLLFIHNMALGRSSFQRKKGTCSVAGCDYVGYLSSKLCPYHLKQRQFQRKQLLAMRTPTRAKSAPSLSRRSPLQHSKQKKAADQYNRTGFATLTQWYNHLWQIRQHISFISGLPIDHPSPSVFAHVLPKGRYKRLKWAENNVVFLTPYEHFLFDHGTEALRAKYVTDMAQKKPATVVNWDRLYDLRDRLLASIKS